MLNEDVDLRTADVQAMSGPDGVARLFLTLGYPVERLPLIPEALGITAEGLKRQVRSIEQIAVFDDWLRVYLLEMRSMRVADRHALARALRDVEGEYLLVLTSDYDTLDVVLLDKTPPKGDGTGAARRQVAVRPRVLTVVRKNPGPVALRVLRRFTCTEAHAEEQFEKLLSAYTVAEWSEPLFNNRALFSDYYLKERLPGLDEWQEDPTAAHRSMRELVVKARPCLSKADDAKTRAVLLEPLFTALGFSPRQVKAAAGDGERPDYLLLDAAGGDEPLVTCLTYPWNRYLDGQDDQRDTKRPTDNPGARVVSLLQDGTTPYAILTNGKLWRLYAAQTHSRATNYYEIDLEEALHSKDRQFAFRYFWLFFRAAAFRAEATQREGQTRRLCFLDRLVDESEIYAKELRERLKDRVFEEITPNFAEGFVAHIRQVEGPHATLNQERLDLIYASTLTFLYRLMFVLYAEALGLLPVNEVHGYWQVSVQRLKGEVAKRGGTIDDESPGHLRKAYRADSTELYDRLLELFAAIDGGSMECNVPRYNGGLFLTEPDPADDDQEARIARFLQAFKIPDRHLALGLDRLARDLDDKTHALVFVDFESLGVRQLGSIYEGLLEFRLRIAPAKMAVVKGKRADEIIPYAEAKQKKRAILTTGRGAKAVERTIAKGEVYLENDRRERKATGSYYTPDYIVRYIVEHTVGPVLEEKLEALRPRLREAERAYRRHVKNAEAKSRAGGRFEDPEKFWNSEEMLRLAYDVLDIKVLDPAMGSGHFLVEVVDAITDRLLDFLNAFPHNPVAAGLRRTREAILEAMEEQRVSIDRDRLNDVALLKRQVLKRCVYGVDLNPMAVELAKVSLWLDAFTLGAPLSFLDHHLRCGNSLIGEFDLSQAIAPASQRWQDVARAAANISLVALYTDATFGELMASHDAFEQARALLKPTTERLNVTTAVAVGELDGGSLAEQYAYLDATARQQVPTETHRKFSMAQRVARSKRFFHWKLEFPEVFVDADRSAWKENAGFDTVVGNPPWGSSLPKQEKEYHRLLGTDTKVPNYFIYFQVRTEWLLRSGGRHGFVLPDSLLVKEYPLTRMRLVRKRTIGGIDFVHNTSVRKRLRPFPDVDHDVVILISWKCQADDLHKVATRIVPALSKNITANIPNYIPQSWFDCEELDFRFNILLTAAGIAVRDRMYSRSDRLGDLFEAHEGIHSGNIRDKLFIPPSEDSGLIRDKAKPLIMGTSHGDVVGRYELHWAGWQVNYDASIVDKSRGEYAALRDEDIFVRPKLLIVRTGDQFVATYDNQQFYASNNLFCLLPRDGAVDRQALLYVLGIVNSSLAQAFMRRFIVPRIGSLYTETKIKHLDLLPIPKMRPLNEQLTATEDNQLPSLSTHVEPDEPERVRCQVTANPNPTHPAALLAEEVERMLCMSKEEAGESQRFLSWLETQLGTSIDDLSGKTIITNYLGDYQKGEGELPWDEFLDRLQRNRSKIRANLSDPAVVHRLRQEYESSLATLLPIKQRLKETDWLIDQIVYKLYGLTEEEIAIVEGRS